MAEPNQGLVSLAAAVAFVYSLAAVFTYTLETHLVTD